MGVNADLLVRASGVVKQAQEDASIMALKKLEKQLSEQVQSGQIRAADARAKLFSAFQLAAPNLPKGFSMDGLSLKTPAIEGELMERLNDLQSAARDASSNAVRQHADGILPPAQVGGVTLPPSTSGPTKTPVSKPSGPSPSDIESRMQNYGLIGAGLGGAGGLLYEALRKKTKEEKKQTTGQKIMRYAGSAALPALAGGALGVRLGKSAASNIEKGNYMSIDQTLLTKAAKVYEAAESVEGMKPKQVYESHKKCAPGEFGMNKEGAGPLDQFAADYKNQFNKMYGQPAAQAMSDYGHQFNKMYGPYINKAKAALPAGAMATGVGAAGAGAASGAAGLGGMMGNNMGRAVGKSFGNLGQRVGQGVQNAANMLGFGKKSSAINFGFCVGNLTNKQADAYETFVGPHVFTPGRTALMGAGVGGLGGAGLGGLLGGLYGAIDPGDDNVYDSEGHVRGRKRRGRLSGALHGLGKGGLIGGLAGAGLGAGVGAANADMLENARIRDEFGMPQRVGVRPVY